MNTEQASREQLIEKLTQDWQERFGNFVRRTDAKKATSRALSPKSLANLDYLGVGPSERIRCGRNTLYPVRQFYSWFVGRMEIVPRSNC